MAAHATRTARQTSLRSAARRPRRHRRSVRHVRRPRTSCRLLRAPASTRCSQERGCLDAMNRVVLDQVIDHCCRGLLRKAAVPGMPTHRRHLLEPLCDLSALRRRRRRKPRHHVGMRPIGDKGVDIVDRHAAQLQPWRRDPRHLLNPKVARSHHTHEFVPGPPTTHELCGLVLDRSPGTRVGEVTFSASVGRLVERDVEVLARRAQ